MSKDKKERVRFGQEFCNRFNITDSELFYEQDDKKAHRMASERYEDLYIQMFVDSLIDSESKN